MYAAYEALSPKMKAYLEGMEAVHDGDHVYRPLFNDPTKTVWDYFPQTRSGFRVMVAGDRPF